MRLDLMHKNENIFFNKIPSFFLIILPFLLITGPFLSDLAVSISAILFLINSIKNKLFKFYKNYFFIFFLIFWSYIIINSLLNNTNLDSLRISFSFIRFGIFTLSTWYLIENNKNILKYLFYSIIICFTLLIVDGYIQFIFGSNILGFKLEAGPRISSFFGDELILGSYITRFFPILFGLFIILKEEFNKKKLLILISLLFIFSESLIFLSGERSAFFFMNLSAIYMLLMLKNYKKYRLIMLTLSLALILVIIQVFPSAKNRIIDQTVIQMNLLSDSDTEKKYIFSKDHENLYRTSLLIFKDNVFFGAGVKNFRNFCDDQKYINSGYASCSTHPHNTYLQFLSELGIFGFMFILSILFYFIYISIDHLLNRFKMKCNKSDFQICMLSAILISLWPFIPTGNFFNNWLCIIYFFPVGLYLSEIKKNDHS
jgi:O-antigen ligase